MSIQLNKKCLFNKVIYLIYKRIFSTKKHKIIILGGIIMSDCTILGFAVGMVAGALIVANSSKAKELVDKGQKAVKEKVEKMK